jgi:carbon storage regulator
MLVLSRKIGEEVVIGNGIRVKVVEIRGGRVRLGIVAPDDIVVDRHEIHEKRLDSFREWAWPALQVPVS